MNLDPINQPLHDKLAETQDEIKALRESLKASQKELLEYRQIVENANSAILKMPVPLRWKRNRVWVPRLLTSGMTKLAPNAKPDPKPKSNPTAEDITDFDFKVSISA